MPADKFAIYLEKLAVFWEKKYPFNQNEMVAPLPLYVILLALRRGDFPLGFNQINRNMRVKVPRG